MLGPVETSYSSLSYQRNFSLTLNNWRQLFNADFAPHRMAPWRPDDPLLPSDAKFRGSSFGFRPIGYVNMYFTIAIMGENSASEISLAMTYVYLLLSCKDTS